MFEKMKKNMPAGIMTVGFIICAILMSFSPTSGQGYSSIVMREFMRETALVVMTECLASAIAFKILLKLSGVEHHKV